MRGREYSVSPDGKCVRQKVSIEFFFHRETQKHIVFHDDFLHENIPTPEQSQELDST